MRTIFMVALVLGSAASSANAAVNYFYRAENSPPVDPATIVNVRIYLQEVVTGGDLSLLVSENGLFGAGFKVVRTAAVPSSPAFITGVTGNPSFTEQSPTNGFTATTAQMTEGVSLSAVNGVVAEDLGGGVRQVLLGTLSITAGSALNETTGFTVAPITPSGSTLTFTNGYDLDVTSTTPAFTGAESTLFNVVTTPEPGSVMLLAVGVFALACRRRHGVLRNHAPNASRR